MKLIFRLIISFYIFIN